MAYPMRRSWSVNGRFLGRNLIGVDRYACEILRATDALIGQEHPLAARVTLRHTLSSRHDETSPFANIPLRLLASAPGHLWEQFILPCHLHGGLLSLCNTGPLAVSK